MHCSCSTVELKNPTLSHHMLGTSCLWSETKEVVIEQARGLRAYCQFCLGLHLSCGHYLSQSCRRAMMMSCVFSYGCQLRPQCHPVTTNMHNVLLYPIPQCAVNQINDNQSPCRKTMKIFTLSTFHVQQDPFSIRPRLLFNQCASDP